MLFVTMSAMMRPRFTLAESDGATRELASRASHPVLARWAAVCAEGVLPLFEAERPADPRPRRALEALRAWLETGEFRMALIREASLAAHAAARAVGRDSPGRSAARSAGQAVAAAHVPAHALAAANYALQALFRASAPDAAEAAVAAERRRRFRRLRELAGDSDSAPPKGSP